MLLNYLRDLMKYTSGLDVDVIKLTGVDGTVKIEGMDNDKTVVIKGQFLKEIPELEGVCGLGNLDILKGFTSLFREKEDTVEIVRNERKFMVEQKDSNGETVISDDGQPVLEEVIEEVVEEIRFKRPSAKMNVPYRVMDRRMIPDQFNFMGKSWDVVIKPSKASIDLLAGLASTGFEKYFGVKTENGSLFITLGDPSLQASFEFAKDVKGKMERSWVWGIAPVLNILKMSEHADCTMSFLDKGALQITLNTGLAEYNYIMPAKAR